MILINLFVLNPIFGRPTYPARGLYADWAYFATIVADYLLLQFLIFFVLDATFFCLLFVSKLCLTESEWPAETTDRFSGDLQLDGGPIHDWIDLKFVGQRTRCVGSLIYYPFAVIALLVVSRSTVFANYPPNLTILISQGISLFFVIACSIMLWWAATTTRDTIKENLMDKSFPRKVERIVVMT